MERFKERRSKLAPGEAATRDNHLVETTHVGHRWCQEGTILGVERRTSGHARWRTQTAGKWSGKPNTSKLTLDVWLSEGEKDVHETNAEGPTGIEMEHHDDQDVGQGKQGKKSVRRIQEDRRTRARERQVADC